jgi:tetratricopeptide (TPR) repeat protein
MSAKFYNAAGCYSLDFRLDTPQALLFFQKALELSKLCGDSDQYSSVLLSIALLKHRTGNYYTAQEYATEAQRLSKLSGNLFQESRGLRIGAMCSTSLGNFEQSMNQLHRGKEILSICGMSGGDLYSGMITAQAENHLLKSEYSEARNTYSQMVEATSPEKSAVSYAISLLNIALIDTMIGADTKDVNSGVDKARKIFRDRNLGQNIKLCSVLQAAIEFREENFTLAKIKFQECLYSVWGADHEAESFCLERLADIRAWPVDGWCYQWPAIYLGHAYKSKDKLAIHKAFIFLGDMFNADKDEETASNLYMIALDGFTHMDVHCSQAKCMIRLGDLAKGQGYISKAIALWKAAQPLFESSSQAKEGAQIDSRFLAVEKDQQIAFLEPGTLNTQY